MWFLKWVVHPIVCLLIGVLAPTPVIIVIVSVLVVLMLFCLTYDIVAIIMMHQARKENRYEVS
jgi:hypothetical protein